MPNKVNKLLVKQYINEFKNAKDILTIGYPKVNVQVIDSMRAKFAEKNLNIVFVRNRIANIALKELGAVDIKNICIGQTAFIWGEDPVSAARAVVDFKKENPDINIHGALVENTILDAKQVTELAKSPTKEELKSILSGQIISLGGKISAQLLSGGGKIASQIKEIGEKAEQAA